MFPQPIEAQIIRIDVQSFIRVPVLRVELLGCTGKRCFILQHDCNTGMSKVKRKL